MPSTPRKKLFCFGFGYAAEMLTNYLLGQEPGQWSIAGTTRDIAKIRAFKAKGVQLFLFDDDHPLDDPIMALEGTTHVLLSIPPGDVGDIAFNYHAEDIAQIDTLKWVGLLSSTSVYGDRNGEWVDESAELRPINKRGSRRALAEAEWQSAYASYGVPLHIFRLAGIYGPGRSVLEAVRAGKSRRIEKPGHVFNRVHIDDIVQTLKASMDQPNAGRAYNVSDDTPSSSHELIECACHLLDLPVPPLVPFELADQAPMARSFYLDHKRVSNARIKEELGITLKYPGYESGLKACIDTERSNRMPMAFFKT